jgi:Tol biopolymer transport system component
MLGRLWQRAAGWIVLAATLAGSGVACAGVAVRQQSVPEARAASTDVLDFEKPVTDGGVTLQVFRLQGEGCEWSPDGQWVAYDCKHQDGYYNIHICRPDGTGDRCLTSLDNGLPHRHAGSPSWGAGGKYLAFTAEKAVHQGGSVEAIPGFGGRSDIWVMRADGSKAWRLTDTADVPDDGVIIPKFSHDGTKLVWAERVKAPHIWNPRRWFGVWEIRVGDFVDGAGGPRLEHVHTVGSSPPGFYEVYGFSPDNRRIIFCSDFENRSAFDSKIYTMDAATGGDVRCLTPGKGYNEHASYSPDGRHIVWMTNVGNKNAGTDWWIMGADGSSPRRLTRFNQPGFPESVPRPVYACLTSWSPDGTQLIGGVQYSLIKQEGRIFLMTLEAAVWAK